MPQRKTIIVCGGRDFVDVPLLWRTLDKIARRYGVREVIDGASDEISGPFIGADYWANQWALAADISTCRYIADWKGKGKAAGPIRNQRMIDEGKPDLVVAFPGGKGTADMLRRAEAAGIETIIVSAAHAAA